MQWIWEIIIKLLYPNLAASFNIELSNMVFSLIVLNSICIKKMPVFEK